MPKIPSFDPSIDECLTLKLSAINSWGHLKRDRNMYGASYIWSRNGEQIAAIGYSIMNIDEDRKRMILEYNWREEPVKYTVELVSVTTNLGNGKRWYFICPHTGKRCLNLISPSGSRYFLHRSAFPNLIYDSQKRSKYARYLDDHFGIYYKIEKLEKEIYTKYRKEHYRGRPTPLVKKLTKLRRRAVSYL